MTAAETYLLERTADESNRLNAQHISLTKALGYTLHPSIHTQFKTAQPLRIADIATGTGAFLLDLSTQLPASTTELHGYDISPDAFPPAKSLPQNVKLNVADAKAPPGKEVRGTYDIVCLRFLNIALTAPEDWKAIASHVHALLQPGGAIQWIEGDFAQLTRSYRSSPSNKTTALERGGQLSVGQLPYLSYFPDNLASVLEEVGFRDVRREVTSTDRLPEMRETLAPIALGAMVGIIMRFAEMGGEGALRESEVGQLKGEMEKELEGGAYVRVDLLQFLAIKKE